MLTDLLSRAPVQSIDEVIAIMTGVDARLPDGDGVKWFNRLYLRVTASVSLAVDAAQFADRPFMTALDVIFANLYFAAFAAAERAPAQAPSAWRPLFQARHQPGIARLQFALAGMNAHINRDLPVAIVDAFDNTGGEPATATARRRDFDDINLLLEKVEAEVKRDFGVGIIGEVDTGSGQLDDIAAMWKLREARASAWTNAEVLWALRSTAVLRHAFFDKLDGLTGLASRGLLLPVCGDDLATTPRRPRND